MGLTISRCWFGMIGFPQCPVVLTGDGTLAWINIIGTRARNVGFSRYSSATERFEGLNLLAGRLV